MVVSTIGKKPHYFTKCQSQQLSIKNHSRDWPYGDLNLGCRHYRQEAPPFPQRHKPNLSSYFQSLAWGHIGIGVDLSAWVIGKAVENKIRNLSLSQVVEGKKQEICLLEPTKFICRIENEKKRHLWAFWLLFLSFYMFLKSFFWNATPGKKLLLKETTSALFVIHEATPINICKPS